MQKLLWRVWSVCDCSRRQTAMAVVHGADQRSIGHLLVRLRSPARRRMHLLAGWPRHAGMHSGASLTGTSSTIIVVVPVRLYVLHAVQLYRLSVLL